MQPTNSHLPHTRQRPRGLFVDRWGTLLATPPRGFVKHPDELEFLPGALDSLYHASRLGWKIYLIGNEDAVAHGQLSESAWKTIQSAIEKLLLDSGIEVARSYACLEHPEGKGIGVRTGQALGDKSLDVDPDLIVADLPAALASLSRAQAEAA